jgi:RNA polymerase sigma-70 factor (ECF subfamily)
MSDDDDDARLMQAVAKGDKAAFATLFDRHQQAVVRFAYRFVGTTARAEELAQDIFVKLYRSAAGYKPTAKFKTYLFRVATNHCLNELRRGDYRVEQSQPDSTDGELEMRDGGAVTPDQSLEGKELERAVGAAMAKMSDRERLAFSMCRFEGLAYKEIADALQASEAAVKSLIHRATLQVMKQVEALRAGLLATGSQL